MIDRDSGLKYKVQVWIYCHQLRSTQFLLLKTRPDRGGFWQPITGSVEEGESLEQAALREAQEETGIAISGGIYSIGRPFEFESRGQKIREYSFALDVSEQGSFLVSVKVDPSEHVDFKWVSAQDASSLLGYPSNAKILGCLLKQLNTRME